MIYAAYKYSQQSNEILFIVSSQNFYQAYKRILYLKQLVLFRKKQVQKIEEINNQLTAKKTELLNLKDNLSIQFSEKKSLLEKQTEELQGISQNKVEKTML